MLPPQEGSLLMLNANNNYTDVYYKAHNYKKVIQAISYKVNNPHIRPPATVIDNLG